MNVMGMTAEEQRSIFHVLAGILHLGNVAFHDGGKGTAAVHDEACILEPPLIDLARDSYISRSPQTST